MIVAVDGPAAAGKGTLARRLAAHFDYAFLDTGLLYRATAMHLAEAGRRPRDPAGGEAGGKKGKARGPPRPRLRGEAGRPTPPPRAAAPAGRPALPPVPPDLVSPRP